MTFVGRETIATVSGIYARFLDLRSGAARIERFDGGERGDGASCIAGLTVAPVFCLVERRSNPRISIFAYPSIKRIAICANSQQANGYNCCAFAGTEYLLAQTSFPDFRLIVWQWRTGEKIADVETAGADRNGLRISCSFTSPYLVARLATENDILSVHRMLVCSKVVRLLPLDVMLSNRDLVSFSWSPEGTLLLCDEDGNVCSVDLDEEEHRRVRWILDAPRSSVRRQLMIVAHKAGVVIIEGFPEDQRHQVQATFYRKDPSTRNNKHWQAAWNTSLASYPICAESHPREDKILILGGNGEIFEMIGVSRDRPPRVEFLLRNDEEYEAIAALSDSHFVALTHTQRLVTLDASTGATVSSAKPLGLKHHGGGRVSLFSVACVTSHPTFPILATCSLAGSCLFIQASPSPYLKIVTCVHLQKEPLDRMKFSDDGRVLGVGALGLGRLFLLVSKGIFTVKVAAMIKVQRRMIDFLIYEAEERQVATILVLVASSASSNPRVGKEILIYSCKLCGDTLETVEHTMKLSCSFESLHHGRRSSREVVGVPYLSKQLHRIELNPQAREASILDALPSLHQTRNIEILVHRGSSRLVTCGYDGLIIVRDAAEPRRVLALFQAHHRSEGGARSAVIVEDKIVSLGRNGDLVANQLSHLIAEAGSARARKAPQDRSSSPDSFSSWIVDDSQRRRIHSGILDEEGISEEYGMKDTWMDAMILKRLAAEEEGALATRLSMLDELGAITIQVKKLLDKNEEESLEARLPVSAFDLDQEARERKQAAAKLEEKHLMKIADEEISRLNRTKCFLRQRFVVPLIVPPRTIFPMFGDSKVTNYLLVQVPSRELGLRSWCRFSAEIRDSVSRLEEVNSEAAGVKKERDALLDECRGYVDVLEASAVAEEREWDLKIRFNESFEDTRSTKKVEMKAANKHVERTGRCIDELARTFHVDATGDLLIAPQWHQVEIANEDFESVLDSLPTSHEESQDPSSKENEEEVCPGDSRFRRDALERMMDGVLELKLEDNAKKNIPKPDCLLRKDPSTFTEDDVRTINCYEKKLEALRAAQREYKSTIQSEIKQIKGEFQERIKAFDNRLSHLSAEKMHTERSILLERLSRIQAIVGHRRLAGKRREIQRAIEMELTPATKEARRLAEECELFESSVAELRNRYEVLRKRDKLLEVKFRAEFPELKQPIVDQLFRHYRKRPRSVKAACGTSIVFLAEVAGCVMGELGSEILPRELVEYLRSLDHLDQLPDGLPSRIESVYWRSLCRLRRMKVEAEIRVRSCAIELAEAEQSLSFYRKTCLIARAAVNRHKEAVQRLEKSLTDLSDDREIRLLLKIGQLPKQPEGVLRSDWEDSILIPRDELVRVKEAVSEAGERKLVALSQLVDLRSKISGEEWRHSCARLKMEELEEDLKDLDSVKVSRIVRECCERYPEQVISKDESMVAEKCSEAREKELKKAVGAERAKSLAIARESEIWRRRNTRFTERITRSESKRDQLVVSTRDPLHLRNIAFQRKMMRSITRKATLARTIRANLEQLLDLKSRLEVSKLRTYPTLRLKL
ncbi:uncharacterized protein LOC143374208 [Andrena cerasifolii]|uniref:uncharacterized protein LOC143374208 n=1 Tax=Andrena cerasifolii TaxID=2819439 RepID=UPI0040380FBC